MAYTPAYTILIWFFSGLDNIEMNAQFHWYHFVHAHLVKWPWCLKDITFEIHMQSYNGILTYLQRFEMEHESIFGILRCGLFHALPCTTCTKLD